MKTVRTQQTRLRQRSGKASLSSKFSFADCNQRDLFVSLLTFLSGRLMILELFNEMLKKAFYFTLNYFSSAYRIGKTNSIYMPKPQNFNIQVIIREKAGSSGFLSHFYSK